MSRAAAKSLLLGFLRGELLSHPRRKLADHLAGVAKVSRQLADIYELPVDKVLVENIAITHDLGKAHPDFQAYLDKKGAGVNHAEPSAWFTYSLTHDLWAAEAVRRHHTNLHNIEDLEADWMPDGVTLAKTSKKMHTFLPEWPWPLTQQDWDELEDALDNTIDAGIDDWLKLRLLYSVLIAADRLDALGISDMTRQIIPPFARPTFNNAGELGEWRDKARQLCLNQAEKVEKPGVYTLTLPTGAGKTLIGLEIARNWVEKFNCRTVIYALPFISVVEQNAAVARAVFGGAVQEDHGLAYAGGMNNNSGYQVDSEEVWQKMLNLFRYWREPVIVTTMVQLWEALFSVNANKTMNFHKLSRAIVILDEPQSISPRLWSGLSDTLNYLSEKLGTIFLFMTATQPHINAAGELAPRELTRPFERHRYLVKRGKCEIENLPEVLRDNLPVNQESGLMVLNTKRAAITTYKAIKELIPDAPILFLSAWMTPWHRKKVLAKLRELEAQNVRRYLVSTQVVEAGVDLDFDWVFRDLGPFDSIVQVAGRCNRHLRRRLPGKVLVAELTHNGRSLAKTVYDDLLLFAANETLPREREFGEDEVAKLLDVYYAKVLNAVSAEPIYKKLSTGKWAKVPPLIETQAVREVDVIIEQNNEVRSLVAELESRQWSLAERHEQKQLFRQLREYMISIPERYVQMCRKAMAGIVTNDSLEPFGEVFGGHAYFMTTDGIKAGLYDDVLGFVPPDVDSFGAAIFDD